MYYIAKRITSVPTSNVLHVLHQYQLQRASNAKCITSIPTSMCIDTNAKHITSTNLLHQCTSNVKNMSSAHFITVYLTRIADGHQNIIRLYGVTKLDGKEKYSLVLEYAEGGTLRNYLRNSNITFKWEDQLRFAKEIASAILWLHNVKEIIHGDLHPNNILIHKDTIKLADFGRSLEKGSHGDNTGVYGGEREKPIPSTNVKYIELYQKCWEHEPDERPDIVQVNSALSSINSSAIFNLEKSEDSKKIDIVHSCQIDHNELCR
ncbi:unnamed protein product [Rhizophagus irregularis]|nr:unnamed protein product [Rhizophagus irregularis]